MKLSSFNLNTNNLMNMLDQKQSRMKSALGIYANSSATKLQNHARQNKPWTNRTYDARNRLNATWEWKNDNVLSIALSHGVDYGIYLEKGTSPHIIVGNPYLYWQGASHPVRRVNHPGSRPYPIIMPTISVIGPQIMAGLNILLR